ncbi:MAG: hypothetical protein ACRDDY_13265 [Clostridium sp.]
MTSQNQLLNLPELLVSLAENPLVLLLLATILLVLALKSEPRDNTPALSVSAYFAIISVLNLTMQSAPYEGLIYMSASISILGVIAFIFMSESCRLSSKLLSVVFLLLCLENGIMAVDEFNFRDEVTLIYELDPYIQLAADAVLILIGGASVFYSADNRGYSSSS